MVAKKVTKKSAPAKKVVAKKAAPKKVVKKAAPKKAVKKVAPKKVVKKSAPVKKTAPKTAIKKSVPAKKAAPKKAPQVQVMEVIDMPLIIETAEIISTDNLQQEITDAIIDGMQPENDAVMIISNTGDI